MADQLDPALRARLERGEIVTERSTNERGLRGAIGRALIAAPPDRVFEVIADFEHYDRFMPYTVLAVVERRQGDELWFRTALDFRLKRVSYTLHVRLDPQRRGLDWTLAGGDLRANEGGWRLEPWGSDESFVTYTAYVDPGFPLPGFMVAKLTESSLPEVIRAVRRRVGDRKYPG